MNLRKFEQSGFILETEKGFRLAFDIASLTPLKSLEGTDPVDAFLVSHIHGDHFSLPHIKKLSPKNVYLNEECIDAIEDEENLDTKITKVKSGDSFRVGEIKVTYFASDHGPNISAPVENLGFLLEVEGQKIYFAGDMFNESGLDVSKLEVDIALLPVGRFYTFGPKEARDFAKKFKSIGKVVPIHYENSPEAREEFIGLAVAEGLNVESLD